MAGVTSSSSEHVSDYLPALRAFARTFCGSSSDADDLVQETVVKALANIDKFEQGTRLKSWLFTIMRNSFYTSARKARRESPGLVDCASNRQSTEASQSMALQSREVGAAIQRLPSNPRQVLVLVTILGSSYEEAAEVCACNVGTIKSRLTVRARRCWPI